MTSDEITALKLGAMAHPIRLSIIRTLVKVGPKGLAAGSLAAPINVAPNAMTFHLQKLANNGLVKSRREGQHIVYSAVFEELMELTDVLLGACCASSEENCGEQCPNNSAEPGFKNFSSRN